MDKDTFRVVTRGADGQIRIRDYDSQEALLKRHCQVGVDDCSTDLGLRGKPVFRGLIGPMPEGQNVVRYESPEVFETLTKDGGRPSRSAAVRAKRCRRCSVSGRKSPMIDKELLATLVCPLDRSPLNLASDQILAQVNRAIAAGRVTNRAGRPVERPLDGGLLRSDKTLLYPIFDDIPLLVPDEAISLVGL